jgi:putative pyruvate formate lyase activating enzyme
MTPAYLHTFETGQLKEKVKIARGMLAACTLCPRMCRVNRLEGETGICATADKAVVSSYSAHFGEEAPLVGEHGSGTIFFSHCNLLCNFCQNYDISHQGEGVVASAENLAGMMLSLQKSGCHNINFVTPSHVVPQILEALEIAISGGLRVPLVYNSSGYDRVETLTLLDGVIDIYMPDFKFWDSEIADATCGAADYPADARLAIKEMHRQTGDLFLNEDGIAERGLLVRHLVMPKGLAGTRDIMRFIHRRISSNTYVNIMPQYRPCGKAFEIDELSGPLPIEEFEKALDAAKEEGVTRLDRPVRRFLMW